MRVILVHDRRSTPATSTGGLDIWMATVAGSITRRGHACELFFLGSAPWGAPPAGIRVHAGTLADLAILVESFGADVIHVPAAEIGTGVAGVRWLAARPAVVVTHHGFGEPGWTSANCDAVTAVSHWGAAEQQSSCDMEVAVVPNGVDAVEFSPAGGSPLPPPIVGWVGRTYDVGKRFDRMVALAPQLRASGFRVWIADAQRACTEAERPQGAPGQFDQWCCVPRSRMASFYQTVARSGGCILCTSESEGMSLAILEAQACGCPVVGAAVNGVSEQLTSDSGGVLYDRGLTDGQLAKLLEGLIRDGRAMARRGELARRHVEAHCTCDRMVDIYLATYERAISKATRGGYARCGGMMGSVSRGRRRRQLMWAPAISQYRAALELRDRREPGPARRMALASLRTLPTIYLRPQRLVRLLGLGAPVRAPGLPTPPASGPVGGATPGQ